MTKLLSVVLLGVLLLAAAVFPALGQMGHGPMGGCPMMNQGMMGSMMGGMARNMFYMHNGVPPQYRGQTSPLQVTPRVIQEGAALYGQQCAACHGTRGFGDGEAGRGLQPPPANLAVMIESPMLNDEFLLWTVSDGGVPLGTGMPAFKGTLSTQEIWKIVAFMRAGFPSLHNSNDKVEEPPAISR
jgi:mono/diheme cytochrome c family protein